MQPIDRLLSAFCIVVCRPRVQTATRHIVSMRVPSQPGIAGAGTSPSVSVAFSNGEMERVDIPKQQNEDDLRNASKLIKNRCGDALACTGLASGAAKPMGDHHVASVLLWQALHFLRADVYGDAGVHAEMLSENAAMFGAKGKSNILEFKRTWLRNSSSLSSAADSTTAPAMLNYDVDAVHHVDVENRVVVANFRSLLPGKEGLGTDILKFDFHFKVVGVEAIRHHKEGFGQ